MSAVESMGKYEIRRQLGRGAMGIVYEGFDPVIERVVAIKTVRLPEIDDQETAEEIARFRREAQAAGRLSHPNIVGVYDYGETSELAYIVMEFVDGPPLKNFLDKNERFPLPRIVQIMADLLAGLQFSHDRGVVHRDIKPANLMLTKSGQAKIADFGIARIESSSMTQAGTVLGTPAYMSPEQFMGQVVDARSDIYSSGVLLYQLLTGERPFEGSMSAIMHKALHTEAPLPSQISVTSPRSFDAVVKRAMAKRPDDRYASAAEFMAAIRAAVATSLQPAAAPDDDGETTMISPPRPVAMPVGAQVGAVAASNISLPNVVVRPVANWAATSPGKSSVLPVVTVGGIAGLAVLGGLVYYVLTGQSHTPARTSGPVTPPVVTVAPEVAPTPLAVTALPAPVSPPTVTQPPSALPPVAQAQPPDVTPSQTPSPAAAVPPVALAQPPPANVSPAAAMPPVTPRPADPGDAIRTELATFVSGLSCSMIGGDVRDGVIELTGIGGKTAFDGLRQKLIAMGVTSPVPLSRVTQTDPVFCPWEDTLRPIARTFGAGSFGDRGGRLSLRIADDPAWLKKDDYIRPRIVTADFRGEVRVDYLDRQGNVMHMYPQPGDPKQLAPADPPRSFQPHEPLNLGDPGPNNRGWQVDEPYGTDVIIAIQSEDALFDRPRPRIIEKAADYLRDLKRAIEAARSRGSRITAAAMPLETRLK